MPFCDNSGDLIQLQTKINEISDREISYRKETNSDSLHRWKQLSLRKQQCTLKAPVFTSFLSGSMTVEAAFVIPMFLFAMLAFLYLFEIMAVQTNIRAGMQYAGKMYAKDAYLSPFVNTGKLQSDIQEEIGIERLDRSLILGGASGIDCGNSYVDLLNQILYLNISYKMEIPIPVFGRFQVEKEETMRVKGWCGYESSIPISAEQTIVYVTETGTVYHKDYHCTYLDLSIHMVPVSGLEDLRNESGSKYYPCELCGKKVSGMGVYITNYGSKYHTSMSCGGLKRKIYAVPISETAGKGACSKCGK